MNLFRVIFENDAHAATAIIYEQLNVSYDQLREQTLTMAKAIAALEPAQTDRVAILLNDSPEFIEAFIATCSLGAIAVPINMALRLEDQLTILNDCSANIAIIEADLCKTLVTDAPEKLHHLQSVVAVRRDNQQNDEHGKPVGIEFVPLCRPPLTVYQLHLLLEQAVSAGTPEFSSPVPDDPAFILYTSGSTGEPKGAVHRQRDIFYTNETFCRQVLHLTSSDRLFSSSRLPFAYGLGNSFSFPLLNGATTILCREKPTPEVISRVFSDYGPTIFFGVPVVYNLLLEHHRHNRPLDCSSLRLCISAGEALPAHLGEEWEKTFGVAVLDGIGSTEMLHMFMSNQQNDVRYGSSGKVLKGYETRLLDEYGQEAPAEVAGHLWVKGPSAAIGYWEKPEETARSFVDGWVRTGDLYQRDREGYWFHMGRSDDCFKSSGQWVSPVEVEGVLIRHEGVGRAAVVEDFDANHLPCPCAFVVSQEVESDLVHLERELRALAAATLPRFKQPRKYVFISELPYTATGKIQRFKLREALKNMSEKSIQETYAPNLACFGCGPANAKGLHIRSFPAGDEVVAEWQPQPEYEAFQGVLSGGIIGTLLDCHCNWTAAWHLMKKAGLDHPPCTVTADYAIKLLRPTPTDGAVKLVARVVDSTDDRAIVEGELIAHDKVCATCRGTFVAVKPGHPAYHRW